MKRAVLALLVAAIAVGAMPAAFGTSPTHQRSDWREVDLEFAHACAFPIHVHIRVKGQLTTFVDGSGDPVRAIGTGPVFATVTNEDTGASFSIAASGPTFFDGNLDLVRSAGVGLFIGDELFSVTGRVEFGPRGEIESIRGHATDLCERLG